MNGSVLTTFELVPIMPPDDSTVEIVSDAKDKVDCPSEPRGSSTLSIIRKYSNILWGRHCLRFASGQTLPPII